MVKRSDLIRAILRKTGQRRRTKSGRPYLTRKELLKVNGFLDVVEDKLGRRASITRSL